MDFILGLYFVLNIINTFAIAVLLGRAMREDME